METPLSKYLSYYQTQKKPGYAVLVDGAWGIGKTFQVRRNILSADCWYVSLFGVNSPDEGHAAVYAAIAPTANKFKEFLDVGAGAAQDAGGSFALGGAAAKWLSAAMRQNIRPERTLIFDDLERCSMKLEEMMGVISTYVEHLGFRVILIADEEKLKANEKAYGPAKEKIVGHTVKVALLASEAFDAFTSELSEPVSESLISSKDVLLEVVRSSDCMSLRVLRHVIKDLERLFACIDPKHRENTSAMSELMQLFVACSIEVRLGRLQVSDLKDRAGRQREYEFARQSTELEAENRPAFIQACERYPAVDLESQLLDDQVLEDALANGVFEPATVQNSLRRSPHFAEPRDVPVWRRVAGFDDMADADVEDALMDLKIQFEKREITCVGDMLHVFALKLLMAEQGIDPKGLEAVRDECFAYIDDLRQKDKLPPRDLDWRWSARFETAYDGYAYWVRPAYEEHFNAIRAHLIEARERALEDQFPTIMGDLLELLQEDGLEFYRRLCHTNGHDSPYAEVPILACMEPSDFVEAWLNSPRTSWSWVGRTLEDRLESHRIEDLLARERDWAFGVIDCLIRKRDEAEGFARLRIDRIIPRRLAQLRTQALEAADL